MPVSEIVPRRIYAKLFSSTYLQNKRIRITDFAALVDFLCWETLPKDGPILVHTLDNTLWDHLKDVTEKIGFQFFSMDQLLAHVKEGSKGSLEKYYFYSFVIYTKASLDSIACTLNSFFNFGFSRGGIDFGRVPFVSRLERLPSFRGFHTEYGEWIERIKKYREAIIHRKSVDLYRGSSLTRLKIPARALSHEELCGLEEVLNSVAGDREKRSIEESIRQVSLGTFLRENIENIRLITGRMSTDVLAELKNRHPRHKSSTAYYG